LKVNIYSYKHNGDKPELHIKRYLIVIVGIDIKDLDHYYELENTYDYREFKRNIELKMWNSYIAIPDMDKLFNDLDKKGFHAIKSEISLFNKHGNISMPMKVDDQARFIIDDSKILKRLDALEKKIDIIHDMIVSSNKSKLFSSD